MIIIEACQSGCMINSSHPYNLINSNSDRIVITSSLSFDPNNIPTTDINSYSWWFEWGSQGPPTAIFTQYLVNEIFTNNFKIENAFGDMGSGNAQQKTYEEVFRLANLPLPGSTGNEQQIPSIYDNHIGILEI